MKYLVLVSHGLFASGLANSLSMLAGSRDDVIAIGLADGMGSDEFTSVIEEKLTMINDSDEVIVLADLIGGSPLTTLMKVLASKEMMAKTTIMGGMNLPLALTTLLMKDALGKDELVEQVLSEAHAGLRVFEVASDDDDEI